MEWGLLHFITRSIAGICMNPDLLKYTLRKKKCNIPTFLRGAFPLLYLYSQMVAKRQSLSIYTPPQKKRNFPWCISFETECRPKNIKVPCIHPRINIMLITLYLFLTFSPVGPSWVCSGMGDTKFKC